jgi:lysophospholipase L1-like esterase
MKKQLLTVGDSFTYGDELKDRYQAWPYRLADHLDYEVHNMGQSGCGNNSILRRTLEELAHTRYDLVVIGWTSPGRIEWKDEIGIAYDIWPGYPATGQFLKDHPWRTDLLSYISQYHNAEYLYQQYLIKVISLQSYCQAHNIEYLMMDARHNDYYRSVGKEMHELLEQQIDSDRFVGFGQFGMAELTNNLPRGPGHHPLEKGHERIADEIAKHIRN